SFLAARFAKPRSHLMGLPVEVVVLLHQFAHLWIVGRRFTKRAGTARSGHHSWSAEATAAAKSTAEACAAAAARPRHVTAGHSAEAAAEATRSAVGSRLIACLGPWARALLAR